MSKEIKQLRIKSWIGLAIFSISIVTAYFYLNHLIIGGISIIGMLVGWFVFSKNHTAITTIQLRQITNEYIKYKIQKNNKQ